MKIELSEQQINVIENLMILGVKHKITGTKDIIEFAKVISSIYGQANASKKQVVKEPKKQVVEEHKKPVKEK